MKAVYLLLIFLLIPLVSAIPEIPHQFYGSVSNSNGAISSGTVTAELCSKYFSVPIINGNYGLSEPLLVSREDCSANTIGFYVDGSVIRTYNYISGGYTQLNLYVPIVVVQNNPVTDNTQDTTDEDDNNGRERESRVSLPPDDLVLNKVVNNPSPEDSVQHLQIIKSVSNTGKAIFDSLTKTNLGIVTLTAGGFAIVLGLVYLLWAVLL